MQQNQRWVDIINKVERNNARDLFLLQEREREIHRKYQNTMSEQAALKKSRQAKRRSQLRQEKEKMEVLALEEREGRRAERRWKVSRELQYQQDNKRLHQQAKLTRNAEQIYIQNPFVRLVDESEKRKQAFRQKLRLQNKINQMQEEAKQAKQREERSSDKTQMHLHTEKVDSFFKDNELSKSQLRQKYLKLNHSEFNSMQSEKRLEVGGNLQQDYLTFLDHQVKLKRQSSQSKDYLDQQLASINKDIAASASSPAYLGKNPISHDRRRQLYYLDKSINNHRSYIRTEGDEAAPTQVDGRRTNQINQIFRQAHKTFQVIGGKGRDNPQSRLEGQPKGEARSESAAGSPFIQKEKKEYMRFDIIEGKHRIVTL